MGTTEKEKGLADFDWENQGELDFFSTKTEEPEKVETVVEEEEEDTDAKKKEKEGKEEDEEISLFEETSEKVKEVEEEEDSFPGSGNTSFISTLELLKEQGFISYELEEGEELDEESAKELFEESFETSVDNKLKEMFSQLPEEAVAFNKFVLNGGTPSEFFNQYQSGTTGGITPDMDLTVKENQIKIVTQQLQDDGYDEEYIETHLEYLEDSGNLEKISEKHFNKWKKKYEENQKSLVKKKEDAVKLEKETRKQLKNKVASFISDKEDIKGFKLKPVDKKDLPTYMYDKSVKLEGGSQISQMQKDLYEALQNDETAVLMAKLLRDKFDFSSITKGVETRVTKNFKNKIQRQGEKIPSKTGGSSQKIRSLADMFN